VFVVYLSTGRIDVSISIGVATHKTYQMPLDPIYLPIQVGSAESHLNLHIARDDTGDNISYMNRQYSELTGLYWIWKNIDTEYKGLVHYRRHFATKNRITRLLSNSRFDAIASGEEISRYVRKTGVLLPQKRHYYIESIYSHYAHTFDKHHLDTTREILIESFPTYLPAFDHVMSSRSAHLFNMFVMQSDRFNDYCSFLFPVINELTERIDSNRYDAFQARFPGRISERLLDVWLQTNSIDFIEQPVISPEPVNWYRKGTSFIKAKVTGTGYKESF
jgi:hypothetical protein